MYGFGGLGQVEVEEEKMSPWRDNNRIKKLKAEMSNHPTF